MKLMQIFNAEFIRVRKKLLIYILSIVYIFWATMMFISNFSAVTTMISNGSATLSQYVHVFMWNNLFATAGNFALSGWGTGLYIFLGAFWIGDDLESNMILNIAVARKKTIGVFLGKITSMFIYILVLHIFIVAWLIFFSAVVYRLPGGSVNISVEVLNYLINSVIMALLALFGVFLSLILNNAAFGSFLGFVLFIICQLLTSSLIVIKYSVNLTTYSMQYNFFAGSSMQRSLIIGNFNNKIILLPYMAGIMFLIYSGIFLTASCYLYNKRAKS